MIIDRSVSGKWIEEEREEGIELTSRVVNAISWIDGATLRAEREYGTLSTRRLRPAQCELAVSCSTVDERRPIVLFCFAFGHHGGGLALALEYLGRGFTRGRSG